MNFNLVKLTDLSGKRATIYSVIINDDKQTLFDQFLDENLEKYPQEIDKLYDKIEVIAQKTGVIPVFLAKPEGKLGQDIYALYDEPDLNLRLYFIRLGSVAIILGGGGYKSKNISAFQEDPKLKEENYILREISERVTERIKSRELKWDGIELYGAEESFFFEDDDMSPE